jgi:biopolymer transport protein ExbD
VRKRARAAKPRPKGAVKADINVTPLVDVVLVLLIIFMVVTPMITSGVPVDLPKTMHHDKKPDDGKDIIISVTQQQKVYTQRGEVTPDKLPKFIEEERRRNPEKTVFLKGDARTTWGAVRKTMEAVHKVNIDDIYLGTDEDKKKDK